jgi:PAS domain S-box-containing protein
MSAEPLKEGALVELLEAAPDGVVLADVNGLIVFGNEAAQQLFGYTREELSGAPIETLVPARYHARHLADRLAYTARPERRAMGLGQQLFGLRKDGSEFPVEISLAPLRGAGDTMIVAIVRDATERREVEEQRVRYARAQAVEEIVAGLEAIVWEATAPDRESMTYLGGRREAFLGYAPEQWLQPGFWLSVVHVDDRITALTLAATAREHDTFELEYRLTDADGDVHQVRDIVSVRRGEDGEIERLSGVIVDITQRRELEARISQAHKMEAVGQLAGGIAHDFNNLLTIVSGYARRLRARPDLVAAHRDLDQIVTATDRAAELTHQLLAFARRGMGEPALINVNDAIHSLEPMLRRVIDADISFEFELDAKIPRVLMDRTALEQILMNLILNASDAMPDGGTLTVTTQTHAVTVSEATVHGVATGDDVRITVGDSGTGMAPEVRDRIFEPFFTTKMETGTGMGLATVYGIVDQAGGWIDLDTAVGVGTTFQVMLPAAAPDAEPPHGERATLLLVEDEPALRRLVATMLEEQGYRVLEAANGLDAIAIAERHRGQLGLLITDVVMPRLSGPELAQQLQILRPGLEVLFMSGYNDSRLVSRGVAQAQVNLLVKPFTPDQLIEVVQELTGTSGVAVDDA